MSGDLPLEGERVLDLSRFVAGSYVTMVLAALGAEVVKVEGVDGGDPYRQQGLAQVGQESALFMSLNTGKRSVSLDFKRPEAAGAVEALLAGADIVVQNARPGALDRYHLDADTVRRRHPHIVYASISAYGEVGPDAGRGGFDLVLQAETGLMSLTGPPGGAPVAIGAPVLDIGTAMTTVAAILAAVVRRGRTGRGASVASSLMEFGLAAQTTLATTWLAGGPVPVRAGSHSPMFAPYGAFRAGDGWLVVAGAGSERLWHRFCAETGLEALIGDERFATNADRIAHRDELTELVEAALSGEEASVWAERLRAAGVPAGVVAALADVVGSAQTEALGFVQDLDHPDAGPYRTGGIPLRIDGQPVAHRRAAPALGADTAAVLREVGLDRAAIEALVASGAAVAR